MCWLLPILAGIALLLSTAANADELHLKDGSVVTGTVVGYEQDSFRVKTSWGYAEIRKDQVAQIVIGGGATDESTSSTSAAQKSIPKKKSTAPPPPISPSAPPTPVQSLPPGGASQPVKGQLLVRAVVSSPNASSVATENSAAAKLVATAPVRPPANARSLSASTGTTAPPTDKLLVNAGSEVDDSGSNPAASAVAKAHNEAVRKSGSSASRAAVAPVSSGTPTPGKAVTPNVSADRTNGTALPAAPPDSVVKPAKLASPSPAAQSSTAAASRADGTASPAPPPKPTKAPPAPEPVHEAVTGNAYTNETYGIHMYRPPDWQLNADARKLMPGAIAALGTADEKTYFFIGLEPAHGVLAENLAEADKRLRGIMENYRAIGDRQVTISGAAATERRFRGTVDGRDWTGIVAVLPRANQLFTVFGITTADSDLSGQIQENVIRRAIDSLAFTAASTTH
jgi:hypothetical protein